MSHFYQVGENIFLNSQLLQMRVSKGGVCEQPLTSRSILDEKIFFVNFQLSTFDFIFVV